MGKAQSKKPAPKGANSKYSWILLLLLLATLYVFWVLPWQLGPRPVRVEFAGGNEK